MSKKMKLRITTGNRISKKKRISRDEYSELLELLDMLFDETHELEYKLCFLEKEMNNRLSELAKAVSVQDGDAMDNAILTFIKSVADTTPVMTSDMDTVLKSILENLTAIENAISRKSTRLRID